MIGILPNRIELMRRMPPKSMGAEIGVYRGDFAAELLKLPLARLYLVDTWADNGLDYERDVLHLNNAAHEDNHRFVLERFQEPIKHKKAFILRMPSVDAAALFYKGELDWIYLDANHTFDAVYDDLQAWAKVIKPGGFICGHDYTENAEATKMNFGVVKAVNRFCEREGWKVVYLTDEEWPSYALQKV